MGGRLGDGQPHSFSRGHRCCRFFMGVSNMNRKSILMTSAVALGLAFGGPALANGKGGGYNDYGKGKGVEFEQEQKQLQAQDQDQAQA